VPEPRGYPVEPPAEGEVADRHLPPAQFLNELRGDLDGPVQVHLGHVQQANLLHHGATLPDLDRLPVLAEVRPLALDIQRGAVVPGRKEPPHVVGRDLGPPR